MRDYMRGYMPVYVDVRKRLDLLFATIRKAEVWCNTSFELTEQARFEIAPQIAQMVQEMRDEGRSDFMDEWLDHLSERLKATYQLLNKTPEEWERILQIYEANFNYARRTRTQLANEVSELSEPVRPNRDRRPRRLRRNNSTS
jgi:hypothetical protein